MAVVKTLWTKGSPPTEYIELIMCRTYGCTPNELDDVPYETIVAHMICMGMENKVEQEKMRKARR